MDKKFLLYTIFPVLCLSLVFSLNALTITPASSATISQNVSLNATTTGVDLREALNCSFYAYSSSTANSTWVKLVGVTNTSTNQSLFSNYTYNTTGLEDSNDYYFNATCYNLSHSLSTVSSGITVSNTVPTSPSSLTPITNSLVTSSGEQTFSSTVTNSKTTGCTYVIARGGATSGNDYITGTGTYSASTCSFTKTFSSTLDNGNWYWRTIASDGSETTSSPDNILQVQLSPVGGNLQTAQENTQTQAQFQQQQTEENNYTIWIVLGILLIIIVVWYLLKK